MEALHRFRTSLGGFNRRDVLKYIETSDAAHRAQLARLEQRLEEAERARAQLEDALSGARDEKGSAAAEEARVRASLEESTAALTRVRGELAEAEEQLAAERAELEGLRGKVAELAPMAEKYEQLKDRVATVELDAHKKAQATVDAAQVEAEQIRGETRQWLTGILGQYDRLRQAVDGLDSQLKSVSTLADGMKDGSEAVQRLKEWGELE